MGLKAPDVDSGSSIVLAEAIEDDRGQQWRIEWIDDYERCALLFVFEYLMPLLCDALIGAQYLAC